MAAPILDPALRRLGQATTTVAHAAQILRQSMPRDPQCIASTSSPTIIIKQSRKNFPLHVLPNSLAQPWELLPMRAAAMEQYPNLFDHSCAFFATLDRDIKTRLPFSLLRPCKVSLDLARTVTNLGIVSGMDFRPRTRKGQTLPMPKMPIQTLADTHAPAHGLDGQVTAKRLQMANMYVRLHLRYDMHKPLWQILREARQEDAVHPPLNLSPTYTQLRAAASMQPPDCPPSDAMQPGVASKQATNSSSSMLEPPCNSLPVGLPLAAVNISRPSRPVLMHPEQVYKRRHDLPSGLLFMYHHQLGLMVDAQAEFYDVPGLVLAHMALPMSLTAQIRGALRIKHAAEAAEQRPLHSVTQLKDWCMLDTLGLSLQARAAALSAAVDPALQAQGLVQALEEQHARDTQRMQVLDTSRQMHHELLAWELMETGAISAIPPAMLTAGGLVPAPSPKPPTAPYASPSAAHAMKARVPGSPAGGADGRARGAVRKGSERRDRPQSPPGGDAPLGSGQGSRNAMSGIRDQRQRPWEPRALEGGDARPRSVRRRPDEEES